MLSTLKNCCSVLASNGVAALPTETVYGLAANALSECAVREIYNLKRRPEQNPLIIHILQSSDAEKIAFTNSLFYKLTELLWPGPLTIILRAKKIVPRITTGGLETVAIRSPNSDIFRNALKTTQLFLAAPSANISNRISPTRASHVLENFKNSNLPVYDGGDSIIGLESTVIDLTVSPPEILRPGPVGQETLEIALGKDVIVNQKLSSHIPKSPGKNLVHYSPITPMKVYRNEKVLFQEHKTDSDSLFIFPKGIECAIGYEFRNTMSFSETGRTNEISKNLYSTLHSADKMQCPAIKSCLIKEVDAMSIAFNDRLTKAGQLISS